MDLQADLILTLMGSVTRSRQGPSPPGVLEGLSLGGDGDGKATGPCPTSRVESSDSQFSSPGLEWGVPSTWQSSPLSS